MREKLNSNPIAQVAVVGVLLLGAALLILGGGGGGDSGAPTTAAPAVGDPQASDSATSGATGASPLTIGTAPPRITAPRPPGAVRAAFRADQTIVLLFVRNGGIEDRDVARIVRALGPVPGVSSFVVPARRIAAYSAITQGVSLDRVPALVVIQPRRLSGRVARATVTYGFQSPQTVLQAVRDATYVGPAATYQPN